MSTDAFKPFVLGRFNVLHPLGSGGLGDVYLAEGRAGEEQGKLFALKVFRRSAGVDDAMLAALEKEARLQARLKHSNLLTVVGVERDGDQPFAVMEYLDGTDLGQLLGHLAKARKKLPVQLAVYVVWSILRAVAYLHGVKDAKGRWVMVAPRDVSPTNVAVNQQGVVKLTDLGANSRTDTMLMAAMGLMKGRMSYLAPEVMQQENPDQRADVFSAGVLLWEALTGRRLFKGHSDEEIITTVLTRDVPPPRSVESAVSPELNDTCLKALNRRPEDRFQTAGEFEQALLQSLAGTTPRNLSHTLGKLVRAFVPVWTPERIAALPRPEEQTTVAEALELGADLLEENTSAQDLGNWSMFNESFERPLLAEEPASSVLLTQENTVPTPRTPAKAPPPRSASARVRALPDVPPAPERTPAPAPRPTFVRDNTPPPQPAPPEDDNWGDATPSVSFLPPDLAMDTPVPESTGGADRNRLATREDIPVVDSPTPSPEETTSPWDALPSTRAANPPADEVGTEILVAPMEDRAQGEEHPPVVVVMEDAGGQETEEWTNIPVSGLQEVTGTEIPVVVDEPMQAAWPGMDAVPPQEMQPFEMPPVVEPVNPDFLMPEDMDVMPLVSQPMVQRVAPPPPVVTLQPEPPLVNTFFQAPVPEPMLAPSRAPLPPPRHTQITASALAMQSVANAPFSLDVPGQAPSALNARDAFALLANPQAPRGYSLSLGGVVTRTSSEMGQLMVLDHLALFPGLGDPPRHQGTTHTGRMGHLLQAYEQQRATGVLSLQSAQGHYAAFFMVEGNLHYICMTGTGVVLMDALIDRTAMDMGQLEALLRLVMMEAEPIYNALSRVGLTQDESMYQAYCAFLIKRAEQLPYWGQCKFEYRPDVRLPYQLPVPAMPVSAVAATG